MVFHLNRRLFRCDSYSFRDAYVAEALCECARKGDYVDISDVRRNIKSERARNSAVEVLREFGLK